LLKSRREFLRLSGVAAFAIGGRFGRGGGGRAQSELPPESGRSLLVNGGFEQSGLHKPVRVYTEAGEFSHFTNPGEITTPSSWQVHHKHSDDFAQPELRPIPFLPPYVDPPRVFRGQQGLQWFTFYRIHDVVLSQKVATIPGAKYSLSARVHAWCSVESDPYESVCEPYQCTQQIGVSTSNAENPFLGNVDWSPEHHIYDNWQRIFVFFEATGLQTTVYLRSWVKWAILHNDLYWDSVELLRFEKTYLPIEIAGGE